MSECRTDTVIGRQVAFDDGRVVADFMPGRRARMIVDAASIDRTVPRYMLNYTCIASKGADDPGCKDRR